MTAVFVATAIGVLVGAGTWLMLRRRLFAVLLGTMLLGYGVNLFVLASGGVSVRVPPVLVAGVTTTSDPVPQALVLTAIVIGFGMSAFLVALLVRTVATYGTDDQDGGPSEEGA